MGAGPTARRLQAPAAGPNCARRPAGGERPAQVALSPTQLASQRWEIGLCTRAGEAVLEPLHVVLEPLPRCAEVLGPQEGVASQQLCKVTGSKRDDQSDDCQVDFSTKGKSAQTVRTVMKSHNTSPARAMPCARTPCRATR